MNIEQINILVSKLNNACRFLDGLPNDGSGYGAFDNALYQLGRVADSLQFMRSSCEDIQYENQIILSALDELESGVQEKIKDPYKQIDFAKFALPQRRNHAYL